MFLGSLDSLNKRQSEFESQLDKKERDLHDVRIFYFVILSIKIIFVF